MAKYGAFIIWLEAEPCKDTLLASAERKCDYPILDLYYSLWPETLTRAILGLIACESMALRYILAVAGPKRHGDPA